MGRRLAILGFVALAVAVTAPAASARPPLPDGCALPQVQQRLEAFLAAAASGEAERVLPFIAPRGELNGFGIGSGQRHWLRSTDPDRVARFVAAQGSAGLRYRFLGGSVDDLEAGQLSGPWRRPEAGPAADDPVVAFGILARVTQAGRPPRAAIGKGGLDCVSGQFFNWQLAVDPPPPDPLRPCGKRPPVDFLDPPRRPIACRTPY